MAGGFWKFTSNYASRVTKILDKPEFTLEELLDEQETIPELLASNSKLVEYFREPKVLEALVDYVVEDDVYESNLEEQEALEAKSPDLELEQRDTEPHSQQKEEEGEEEQQQQKEEREEQKEEEDVYQQELKDDDDDNAQPVYENGEGHDRPAQLVTDIEQSTDITTQDSSNINGTDETSSSVKDAFATVSDGSNSTDSDSDTDSDSESDLDSETKDPYQLDALNRDEDDEDEDDDDDESFGDDINMDDDDDYNQDTQAESLIQQHSRRAQVAAEILSVDVWSLTDAFMENTHLIEKLWSILDKPSPLPIFLATYFMKINEHLLEIKMDEMINFILQEPCLIERFMRHIDTPPLMDFLLKVISTDKPDASTGIIDVLKDQGLIPALISYLGPEVPSSVQSAAGDFLKAFITISANNAENTTIGPNELSRQLVSEPMIRELVKMMLYGGTGLSNGVGIVIEIIRKNNSDYDAVPVVYITIDSHPPTPRDPIYLGTLVKVFSEAMPDFTKMLERKTDKVLETPFGQIEPLGFERFKICELVAELIHCSNMALLNHEKGEEIVKERDEIRETLIQRQKQLMRDSDAISNGSIDEVDISRDVENLKLGPDYRNDDNDSNENSPALPARNEYHQHQEYYDESDQLQHESSEVGDDTELTLNHDDEDEDHTGDVSFDIDQHGMLEYDEMEQMLRRNQVVGDQLKIALYDNNVIITILNMFFKFPWNNFLHNVVFDIVQQILNASMEIGYNKYLAVDLFGRGNITKLIIDGHIKCLDYEEQTGLRLGYMGHLTLIAEEVVKFTSLHLHNSKSSIIEDAIMLPEWTHYVNETLVETRNKYNAVLGNDDDPEEGLEEEGEEEDDEDDMYAGAEYQTPFDLTEQSPSLQDPENYSKQESLAMDPDKFARYLAEQMTSDLPDKFGSSDEDSDEDSQSQQLRHQSQQENLVSSSIGGHPYHRMNAGGLDDDVDDLEEAEAEDDDESYRLPHPHQRIIGKYNTSVDDDDDLDDDYEDPNDDGQSYVKDNHPLYQADGTLNYHLDASGVSELPVSDSDSDSDELVMRANDEDDDDIVVSGDNHNELTRSTSQSS